VKTEEQPAGFQPTRWSVVLAARGGLTAESRPAVERLIGTYWGPVYWAIRRGWGKTREDAKDLVQEFFTHFLERGVTAGFDPDKGRFRSYLYAALRHFLQQEKRDRSRLKRGGGKLPFSLDELHDDGTEPADASDRVFHDQWVRTVLEEATARLREEGRLPDRGAAFRAFELYDLAERDRPTYESVAASLGVGVDAVHRHLRSMRQRLRELIRAVVVETIADPRDLEDELRSLFG